jgi:hypothetical protein
MAHALYGAGRKGQAPPPAPSDDTPIGLRLFQCASLT